MHTPSSRQAESTHARAIWSWVIVAVAVRLLALLWAGTDLACSFDECSYLELAQALAGGAGWVTVKGFLWPPGYPLFLAPLVALHESAFAARLVQSVLGALLIWPAAIFAATAARPLSANRRLVVHCACGFVALDPTLIAFSHLLWPETIFLLLFVTATNLVIETGDRWRRSLLAGALFGAAGLVKAIGFWLVFPIAAVLAASVPRPRRWRTSALLVLGAVLIILPWTLRNAAVYGRFVLIDATAGTNLYLGNTDAPPVTWDWGAPERSRVRGARERCDDGDLIQRERCEQRRALGWIAAHPTAFARRAVTKWADLVNPTSFLVRQVRAGRYQGVAMSRVSPGAAATATLAAALPWAALAVLAAWGLALSPPAVCRRVVLALVLSLLAVHALTFGMSRFRLPLVPFLAAYAGVAVACFASGEWWPRRWASRLGLAAVLAALLWLWGLRVGPLLDFSPLRVG
jgi:hypothetical protein